MWLRQQDAGISVLPASAVVRFDRGASFSWLLLLVMAGCVPLAQPEASLSLSAAGAVVPALAVALISATALLARRVRMPRVQAAATAFLQMTVFTLLALVLSYAIAAAGAPLWDERLAAWDRTLGLDWPAIRTWLDDSPLLVWVNGLAYHSLIPQMIVVIVGLAALGQFHALRVTVCAAILSGFATVLLSGFFPAMGTLFDPAAYQNLWPPVAWLHADTIIGLRNGSLRVLDLRELMGIVTFPSYHAALAAIFIWAFRYAGRLRQVGAAWALLTILATPIGGGHYAVDVLAGLLLALASLALAQWLLGSKSADPVLHHGGGQVPAPGVLWAGRRAPSVKSTSH